MGPAAAARGPSPDILLVTCVKTKAEVPSAAKDLYRSPLFVKQRTYAERLGVPWFILSAEFGLVCPDDWLAPYERYLPDTPPEYRAAWGAWVVERLALLHGSLRDVTVEIHASAEYLAAIGPLLLSKGAAIVEPLAGLQFGQRLAWYDGRTLGSNEGAPRTTEPEGTPTNHGNTPAAPEADVVAEVVRSLLNQSNAITPSALLSRGRSGLKMPGMYSWWVDVEGAEELSSGLGHPIEAGLIYVGLAGATRWPSSKKSGNSLWGRLVGMHLGNKADKSTLRLTLGAILGARLGWDSIDESAVTRWMETHLSLVPIVLEDADQLGRVEAEVLKSIDPPLNLSRVSRNAVRTRLSRLRSKYAIP